MNAASTQPRRSLAYNSTVSAFYIENFGCRATQADGAAIERQLLERGLTRASTARQADLIVLNTCTVTAAADQDARAAIRRIQRDNPGCRVLVTGCYAQRAPQEVAALEGVHWVLGNSHKHEIGDVVCGATTFVPISTIAGKAEVHVGDIFAHTELLAAPVFGAGADKTRPNLKVQDGCDNRCSFCVIPAVRGHSRSLPVEEVLSQVRALVHAGYREVVVSGINLGRWGKDFGCPSGFASLLRAVLDGTEIDKLRVSSVEPMDWTPELIALVANSPRIAKHAHVPMQSGSDAVLRRMYRKYRPSHYEGKIRTIRAAMPDAAIGADVMVGFPGETDDEFEQTRRMIEELPFTYLHVFTYSSRPGTRAAAMPAQVPVQVARERNRILRELAADKKRRFMQAMVGRELEAITLADGGADATEALTDNYLKVRLRGRHGANQWVTALIDGVTGDELGGAAVRTP